MRRKISKDLKVIDKLFISKVEERYEKLAKKGIKTTKKDIYYYMLMKTAIMSEKVACSQKTKEEKLKQLEITNGYLDIILKDLVPEEVNSILTEYETEKGGTKKSKTKKGETKKGETEPKMNPETLINRLLAFNNNDSENQNYEECLQALYLKEVNQLAIMLAKNGNKEDLEKQKRRINLIKKCDKGSILDTSLMYEAVVGMVYESAENLIIAESDEEQQKKFRELLMNEDITYLAREIFPREILPDETQDSESEPKKRILSNRRRNCPSPLDRLSYIKRCFGIKDILIPARSNDDFGNSFVNLDGTYIIETYNPGIVIIESFYRSTPKGLEETTKKATYVLSKEYADEIILNEYQRQKTRDKAKENNEIFEAVVHTKNYYDNLMDSYCRIYTECKIDLASKSLSKYLYKRSKETGKTKEELMAENTPEVFEAKRKAIAILGPISGDRELHEQAKQEKSSNPHGQGTQVGSSNPHGQGTQVGARNPHGQGAQGEPRNSGSANER